MTESFIDKIIEIPVSENPDVEKMILSAMILLFLFHPSTLPPFH